MYVVRPIQYADLPALEQLASQAPVGTTTLPKDRDTLSSMIAASRQAFQSEVEQPGPERYYFVLEERGTGTVIGISGLEAAVGMRAPFYSYREQVVVHASSDLHIHNRIPALYLCQDYTGATLVSTLFLDRQHKVPAQRQLMSLMRFLFLAEHRQRFAKTVFSEIRGVTDEQGRSPFWESLGRHFFSMDFSRADQLTSISNKAFIAELMPQYPVYVPLLSAEAQDVLGVPHDDSLFAYGLLENEGFASQGYIDIFDGGPTIECQARMIRTVAESALYQVVIGDVKDAKNQDASSEEAGEYLVCNTQVNEFRGMRVESYVLPASTAGQPASLMLSAAEAAALQVSAGERVRAVAQPAFPRIR
ncbi:arginine N-succinyltransferase [Pokkaliibacter sp. MBI-7]|uniref:arginine N-succinyltransferase n=1 Tax=Pokkaliibacter sp. MBI-7 TaxID=3040600 RepID=UPI00244C3261|nr:arginine N-succinyltransferase [Pokkaliibacter sp. MBI-7]MDH2433177.1 arginine N-succinyltransferase [Pokkaliibacter sp. MBI-7]